MKVYPLKLFRPTSNKLFIIEEQGQKFLLKQYRGPKAQQHRTHEKNTMRQWLQAGFNVPEIHNIEIPQFSGVPYLVMRYIEGVSFRKYLCNNEIHQETKLKSIKKLFELNNNRHKLACNQNNLMLIQHDANTGNIILGKNNTFFNIDFEAQPTHKDVRTASAVEIATLTRWIVRDLQRENLTTVVSTMAKAYNQQSELLDIIIKRTNRRLLQFYHRWNNKRRLLKNPAEITKYDISDTLSKLLTFAVLGCITTNIAGF